MFGPSRRSQSRSNVHGSMRTRAFEQDDAHVFCREPDVENDVACFIALLTRSTETSVFPPTRWRWPQPAARGGDDATWEWSEAKLGDAGAAMRPRASINPGECAFYGPKLEFAWRVNGGAGDGHRRRMRNEGRPGKPARARRFTGRPSAHRAVSRLQARGPAGRPCGRSMRRSGLRGVLPQVSVSSICAMSTMPNLS